LCKLRAPGSAVAEGGFLSEGLGSIRGDGAREGPAPVGIPGAGLWSFVHAADPGGDAIERERGP